MKMEFSLGDTVRQFALLMKENGVLIPFKNEEPWHLLFYQLKKGNMADSPEFLALLRFDSRGHYPRCRELSEFLHGLHIACTVDVGNPSYEEMFIPPDVIADWKEERARIPSETIRFLASGFEIVKKEFQTKQGGDA